MLLHLHIDPYTEISVARCIEYIVISVDQKIVRERIIICNSYN